MPLKHDASCHHKVCKKWFVCVFCDLHELFFFKKKKTLPLLQLMLESKEEAHKPTHNIKVLLHERDRPKKAW